MTTVHTSPLSSTPNLPQVKANDLASEAKAVAKKVVYYVGYAFAGFAHVVVTVVGSLPKLIIDLTLQHFYPNHPANHVAKLKEDINRAQLENLRSLKEQFIPPKNNFDEVTKLLGENIGNDEITDFVLTLDHIQRSILNSSNKRLDIRTEDIFENLSEILNSKVYIALQKSNPNSKIVLLLQSLVYAGMTADGSAALREYGRSVTGNLSMEESFSLDECANIMDKIVRDSSTANWNHPISQIFWNICDPLRSWHAAGSHLIPTEFNAHHGNSYFSDCTLGTAKRILGPTPTDQGLYGAFLGHLKRHNMKESRVSQQDGIESSEKERVKKFHAETEISRNDGTLGLSLIPFDLPIMTDPLVFFLEAYSEKEFNPTNFMNVYKDYLRVNNKTENNNGLNIPESALSRDRINAACLAARTYFEKMSKNNNLWNELSKTPEGKARLCRMMQLGVQAIMRADMIYQDLSKYDPNSKVLKLDIISEACKQDVDRGPTLNIATQLFFGLLSDNPSLSLSKEQMHSIIGTVIGRAMMVDGRLILWRRYEVLSDLLHFIGNENNMNTLAEGLKEHVSAQTVAQVRS